MFASVRRAALAWALLALAGCHDGRQLQQVTPEPVVAPLSIDFGLVSLHGHAQRSVKLTNGGRAPLGLYALQTSSSTPPAPTGQALSASAPTPFAAQSDQALPLRLGTTEGTGMQVTFSPRQVGAEVGQLTLVTDSVDQGGLLVVPLKAQVVDAQASIEPHNLDFGKIEIGTTAVQMLHVRNDSPLTVTVTPVGAAPESEMFAVQPVTVASGQAADMPVSFTPTRAGKIASAIDVSRCEGCGSDRVNLYGEGLESAIVVDPNPVDFGGIPVDASLSKAVRVTNVSTVPVELKSVALSAGDQSFTLEWPLPDLLLVPGAWLATSIRFSPTHLGSASGTFKVYSSSKRHPELDVPVSGRGGGAEVAVSPDLLDFGTVPVGGAIPLQIHVRNAGSTDPLTIYNAQVMAGAPDLRLLNPPSNVVLQPNQVYDFTAVYEPQGPGTLQGQVAINSSDNTAPYLTINAVGTARDTAPCDYQILPAQIDFGTIAPGGGGVLGIRFVNNGTDLCAVRNVHIDQDAYGAFFMPGGPIVGGLIDPGDSFQTQVAFQPVARGIVHGNLTFGVSNPNRPVANVPLVGNSQDSCLVAAPTYLDFGALRTDCPKQPLTTRVENACSGPVTVTNIAIGVGTSNEFSVIAGPALPTTLQSGDGFNLTVAYAGLERGQNFSPLFLTTSDLPIDEPLLIPLLGEGLPDGKKTDTFTQADGTKADVLFVVDNTASMAEEQPRLRAAIPAFVQAARAQGMDLHVAVTTTGIAPEPNGNCPGGAQGGEAGRIFPADSSAPRIIDLTGATDPIAAISANTEVGYCHHLEQGLEAVRRALSSPLVDHADDPRTPLANDGNLGFLRDDAQLSVVVVSDEDDHSGDAVGDYATFLLSVKGVSQPQRVAFYALAPLQSCPSSSGSSAPRYAQMAQLTGGQVWDVCSSSYDPALGAIADRAFGNTARFPLTGHPDTTTLVVSVDGQVAAQGSWSYDPGSNAVVFQTGSEPATGAHVTVTYRQVCQ